MVNVFSALYCHMMTEKPARFIAFHRNLVGYEDIFLTISLFMIISSQLVDL